MCEISKIGCKWYQVRFKNGLWTTAEMSARCGRSVIYGANDLPFILDSVILGLELRTLGCSMTFIYFVSCVAGHMSLFSRPHTHHT